MVRAVPAVRRDPLIIGGGPAGSAAAITLGRAGYRPVVLERAVGPADKVCGDFLSVDSIERIVGLGVDPVALGAAPIHRVRLIHGERVAESPLPFPALGVSRRVLDAALLSAAERAGAVVRIGESVRRLTRVAAAGGASIGARGEWVVQTSKQAAVTADIVFLATGKHDLRDLPRPRPDRGAIGMKMYLSPVSVSAKTLEGVIELTLFPGGYAGMQHVENGRVVLCLAVQRDAFQRYGGGWAKLIAAIEQGSRRFAMMLGGARMLLQRPLAVAGVPYGYRVRGIPQNGYWARAVSPDRCIARDGSGSGLYRVGDQAAVIPSLTGDGMAIALHSGQMAAETWLTGGDSGSYHASLARTLGSQMRLAGLLHYACMGGMVQSALVRGAGLFPGVLRHVAQRTRVRGVTAVRSAAE